MKRIIALILVAVMLVLSGCSLGQAKKYSATWYDIFDTVTTVTAYAENAADFEENAENIHRLLLEYHKLFDIYNSYDSLINLKFVNENAGIAPVKADSRIIALLQDCKRIYTLTEGKVNAAMGAVLQLWHQARTDSLDHPDAAYLPDADALKMAAMHCDFDAVIIDEAASTVYFSDPQLQLDVGAIAKGWATQKVAEVSPAGWLLSVGGNICVTGTKPDGSGWSVAIQDPADAAGYLHLLSVTGGCIATSGDYQRTYQVGNKSYHHIIDPATLYPSERWRSVTVVCPDSAMADALSTALFLSDIPTGQALLDQYDADALWVDHAGELFYSNGMQDLVK